jgi:hypothetical protein
MKHTLTLLALIAVITCQPLLIAHHGRGASFDMNKQVTLKGTVSRVDMDVKDAGGTVVTWAFENAGVSQMAQAGYNRNTLKLGQEITAVVNPAANGTPTAIVVKVILADGSEIMSREAGTNPLN